MNKRLGVFNCCEEFNECNGRYYLKGVENVCVCCFHRDKKVDPDYCCGRVVEYFFIKTRDNNIVFKFYVTDDDSKHNIEFLKNKPYDGKKYFYSPSIVIESNSIGVYHKVNSFVFHSFMKFIYGLSSIFI